MTHTPTDTELLAGLRALGDAEAAALGAIPDPAYLVQQRALFVALCTVYGSWDLAEDYDEHGYGGLFVDWLRMPGRPAAPRVIDGCTGLTRLADDAHGGAL